MRGATTLPVRRWSGEHVHPDLDQVDRSETALTSTDSQNIIEHGVPSTSAVPRHRVLGAVGLAWLDGDLLAGL